MGTRPPDRGFAALTRSLEHTARSTGAHTWVINGYIITNPGFQRPGLMSFLTAQLGYRAYPFRPGMGPALQLVKHLD